MSDVIDDASGEPTGSGLRRQLEEANARNKALADEFSALKAQFRASQLEGTIAARGLNPKIAALIPPDVDASAWLDEHKELFGPVQSAAPVVEDPARFDGMRAAQARMQGMQATGEQSSVEDEALSRFQATLAAAPPGSDFKSVMLRAR